MEAQSGPYGIKRLALQVEMLDGRLMTFYANEANAAGATVTVETRSDDWRPSYSNYTAAPPLPQTTITVAELNGYVMLLRNPEDIGHDPIEATRKGIEA